MFATMAPNMQWQKIATNLGCSSAESGIIAAFISIALLMGSEIARYFKDRLKNKRLEIVITQMFVGLNIALVTTFVSKYPIITFFLLHEIGRGAGDVLRGAFIQECIPSKEERATLGSFVSMVEHLCGAAGLIISGLMADKYGYNPAWVISGAALVLVTLTLLPQCRKESG
jgi:predicted MFS family arabinose efflux permease